MQQNLRFVIVEDQKMVRELLVAHLRKQYQGAEISEVDTLAGLRTATQALEQADICVLDLELPDGNALEWLETWPSGKKLPKTVIVSSVDSDVLFFKAVRSGIAGFVHKNDGTDMLTSAIETVLKGGMVLSPTVQRMRTRIIGDPNAFHKILTEREQKILKFVGEGLSNEEIAQMVGLRESTVIDHKKNISQKLDLHSSAELMRYAIEKGFSRITSGSAL